MWGGEAGDWGGEEGTFWRKSPLPPSKPPPISLKDFQLVGRLHERSSFHSSAVRKQGSLNIFCSGSLLQYMEHG